MMVAESELTTQPSARSTATSSPSGRNTTVAGCLSIALAPSARRVSRGEVRQKARISPALASKSLMAKPLIPRRFISSRAACLVRGNSALRIWSERTSVAMDPG